jgi:hypothetical protein
MVWLTNVVPKHRPSALRGNVLAAIVAGRGEYLGCVSAGVLRTNWTGAGRNGPTRPRARGESHRSFEMRFRGLP